MFRFHRASVFCVQEALPGQMEDLAAAFPGFSYEGVGRDDGIQEGEFSAFFLIIRGLKRRREALSGYLKHPGSAALDGLLSEELQDAYHISLQPPYGSVATFHGFTYDDPPRERIDYVFVSRGIGVLRYGGLTDSRDRAFFSDHLPVLVTLEL